MDYNRPFAYQGKPLTAEDRAYEAGGFRERFAMRNGKRYIRNNGNHVWWIFRYPSSYTFQDGNGAIYDATEGRWVG